MKAGAVMEIMIAPAAVVSHSRARHCCNVVSESGWTELPVRLMQFQ